MGLSEFFWNLGAWNWFIVAVALFALESVVPGVHFVWFGIAAVHRRRAWASRSTSRGSGS